MEEKIVSGLIDGKVQCKVHFKPDFVLIETNEHGVSPVTAFMSPATPPRLEITLEDGKIATLLDIFPAGRSARLAPSAFVQTKLGCTRTVVGPEPFHDTPVVRSIRFTPSNELLSIFYVRHRNHTYLQRTGSVQPDELMASHEVWGPLVVDVVDQDRLEALTEQLEGLKLKFSIAVSTHHTVQGTTLSERRRAELEYGEPRSLWEALRDVTSLCDFFSLMVGEVVVPQEMEIDAGVTGAVGLPELFSVHVATRPAGKEISPKDARRCLLSIQVDPDLYSPSLVGWMERREEWTSTYRLGSETLSRQREVSRYRFLDGLAWFESIPDFYLPESQRIPKSVVAEAAHAAQQVFAHHKLDVDEARIRGLLSPINVLSLKLRLVSAVEHIRLRFGPESLPSVTDELCSIIPQIRGAFAHGANAFEGEHGSRVLEASLLVETICRYLTLSSLPVDLARIRSALHHPMNNALQQLTALAAQSESTETEPEPSNTEAGA